MRRPLTIILLLFSIVQAVGQDLDATLSDYLEALKTQPIEVQIQEADFMIETCTDSATRQTVALKIFDHYLNSNIMGAEAVAVHLCDEWFIPGKIQMRDPAELMTARIFAEFNRQSLIGKPAPELTLRDTTGVSYTLRPGADGRWTVLYFYDTDCAKCKLETVLLENILENGNWEADVYAIYTKDDEACWRDWTESKFSITAQNTRLTHLWDPDFTSDFQYKYGVLETPSLFLVGPDGKIAGRRLDSMALETLMNALTAPKETVYGSAESEAFYDRLFGPVPASFEEVRTVADHIAGRTLEQERDTLLFKQMVGDLMYWLSGERAQGYKLGMEYLTSEYIINKGEIWNNADDSLKVVQFALAMNELTSRAAVGTKIPGIKVKAVLKSHKGNKEKEIRLDKLRFRRTYIIFHTQGCNFCKAEIAAAESLLQDKAERRTRVLLIDMDEVFCGTGQTAQELFDTFDLTVLPYITVIDRKGVIQEKYVSLCAEE